MNAPFQPAHSLFGGSAAGCVLGCPGSVKLIQEVPVHLRKPPSVYADRGTALHAAMALLLGDDPPALNELVGWTANDYTITRDDVELALRPAYAVVDALLSRPGAEYYIEKRVIFPSIDGAFGTLDLLIRIGNIIYVIDFKFGFGVRVRVLVPDGDTDVINSQTLFYTAGARHSLPDFFAGVEQINLMIIQPQSAEADAEMISTTEVTHAELDEFIAVYRAACIEALSNVPRLQRGDWCRFCPAKLICPEHAGPLLDLAKFVLPAADAVPKEAYLLVLAAGLDLLDAVRSLHTEVHSQAKRALESGDIVPGFALSAGRAERRWRDNESTTITALESLGLSRDDVVAKTMRSPKQVELRAKAHGLEVPQELIVSTRSGVSLVRDENVRVPIRGRDEIARSFAAALTAFLKGGAIA
jgi:hypothetical protein